MTNGFIFGITAKVWARNCWPSDHLWQQKNTQLRKVIYAEASKVTRIILFLRQFSDWNSKMSQTCGGFYLKASCAVEMITFGVFFALIYSWGLLHKLCTGKLRPLPLVSKEFQIRKSDRELCSKRTLEALLYFSKQNQRSQFRLHKTFALPTR